MNGVNELTPCAHHPFTVRCNSTPEITIPPCAFGMPRLAPPLLQGHWGGGTTFTSMEACLEVLHSSAGADNWLTHLQSLFSGLPALLMSTTENVWLPTVFVWGTWRFAAHRKTAVIICHYIKLYFLHWPNTGWENCWNNWANVKPLDAPTRTLNVCSNWVSWGSKSKYWYETEKKERPRFRRNILGPFVRLWEHFRD